MCTSRGSRVKTNGKHHYVHRLVAQAFLGAPKSQSLTVDHLDRVGTLSSKTVSCHHVCQQDVIYIDVLLLGLAVLVQNKSNNCLDNLSWADMKTQNSNQRKDKRKRPRAEIQQLSGERWLPIDLK
eukprot:COSAG06_NODE_98_length_24155_cov_29.681784_6_plen_125_part_00